MKEQRIYLSPPNISEAELLEVKRVFQSGWIAPYGSAIDSFEKMLGEYYPRKRVLLLNSGTSALHLALILAGVGDGDEVLVSSFTFAACANVILYERAIPIFIDSESRSWNLDPDLLEEYLSEVEKPPKALIVTHLYGMPADIRRITSIASRYGIKVIEDGAESLGATNNGNHIGGVGDFGVISFNGNKIVTTSGGGALICEESEWERGKYLASQANSGMFGYNHKEVGYNYGMSNVLAGIGLAQLSKLNSFVEKKRWIYQRYMEGLSQYLDFIEEPSDNYSNRWLTTALLKKKRPVIELVKWLDSKNIETRRLWKPLHMHEAYSEAPFVGMGVCEQIYEIGICLPSGTGLDEEQLDYVIDETKKWFNQ